MNIPDYANEAPASTRLGPLAGLLRPEDLKAPIDVYLKGVASIIGYGTRERLEQSDFIGRLLLLGIVSAAEGYMRSILAACIESCPVCRAVSSEKQINLGGLLWHGRDGFSRSAFEHASFTSRKELVKACREFIGYDLEDAKFKSILEQFDIVCQLRHGVVHGDGFLPGRNAVMLDIPRYDSPVRITIRYSHLQDVAASVNTLILTLNRELFAEMCKRWAVDWRKRADWVPDRESQMFGQIWSTFFSSEANRYRPGRTKLKKGKCMLDVKALYGV